jgi:hypothetical protein
LNEWEDKEMGVYQNAMELLVTEEVKRQLQFVPPRMMAYVNQTELLAYALNQLPGLYATSEAGLAYQLNKGRAQYHQQIVQAVRRAFAAINRDPIRQSTPLPEEIRLPRLQETLYQLRQLLKNDKLEWETLPVVIEQALGGFNPGQSTQSRAWSPAAGQEITTAEYERLRRARHRIARWKNRLYREHL